MKISDKFIKKIWANKKLMYDIAIAMEVHIDTVERWVSMNLKDGKLTTSTVTGILSEEFGVPTSDFLIYSK